MSVAPAKKLIRPTRSRASFLSGSRRRKLFRAPLWFMCAIALPACSTINAGTSVAPLAGPAPTIIRTDYSAGLKCLAAYAKNQRYPAPRIAVGHISDLTGANDFYNGRRLTQGATLMAMTAVADAGMRLIERFDMGVIQVEMDYAKAGLVRDSSAQLRKVSAGELQGADLYIIGGITEFNPNIQSGGIDLFVGGTGATAGAIAIGASYYIIDVGIDLRLVDARSSEVLSVRSFRKQIVGQEKEGGAFDFLGGVIADVGGGKKALEPVQSSVRSMIDRAVYEFVSGVYGLNPKTCHQNTSAMDAAASERGADRFFDYQAKRAEPVKETLLNKPKNIQTAAVKKPTAAKARPLPVKTKAPNTQGSSTQGSSANGASAQAARALRTDPQISNVRTANFAPPNAGAAKARTEASALRKPAIAPTPISLTQSQIGAAAAAPSENHFVQLGAYSNQQFAQAMWNKKVAQQPALLASLTPEIAQDAVDKSASLYLIRVGPMKDTHAQLLCSKIQGDCLVTRMAAKKADRKNSTDANRVLRNSSPRPSKLRQ